MTKKPALINFINVLLSLIIVVLILAIICLLWIISPMKVSGNSMQNTLQDNDIIWVQKTGYSLQKGDVIVFKRPGADKPPVKRIIATQGDTVQFDMIGYLTVDDKIKAAFGKIIKGNVSCHIITAVF